MAEKHPAIVRLSFHLRLKVLPIKAWVEGVEILAVKPISSKAETFPSNGFLKKTTH